jgi:hypothetical protein
MHKLIKKGEFTSYLTKNKEKTNKIKIQRPAVEQSKRPRGPEQKQNLRNEERNKKG